MVVNALFICDETFQHIILRKCCINVTNNSLKIVPSCVPVTYNAQHQEPETETAKWNSVVFVFMILGYTSDFSCCQEMVTECHYLLFLFFSNMAVHHQDSATDIQVCTITQTAELKKNETSTN